MENKLEIQKMNFEYVKQTIRNMGNEQFYLARPAALIRFHS